MSYITDFETAFRKNLASHSEDELVAWTCEKVLESYRNGIGAGREGKIVARAGQSRRRGSYGKTPGGRASAPDNLPVEPE